MIINISLENIELFNNFNDTYFNETGKTLNLSKEIKDNPYINYIGYVSDNKIIGYLSYEDIFDRYEISNLYVLNNYRGNKIGSYLMQEIIDRANLSNIKNITLEVNKENLIAINLYKKYGFVPVAVREKYYSGVDGILMEKEMI
ncbi:MAG: GNAT family N-acetyltransferase [Bacilli bacterium]